MVYIFIDHFRIHTVCIMVYRKARRGKGIPLQRLLQ